MSPHIRPAKRGQDANRHQFPAQRSRVLIDPPDGGKHLLLGSSERISTEGVGAEVVFEVESVQLNSQLRVLNAGGDFGIDGVSAQGLVYDVELDLGADGTLSLTKAGLGQKASEGVKIRPHLGCKPFKIFRREFRFVDGQSHGKAVFIAYLSLILVENWFCTS